MKRMLKTNSNQLLKNTNMIYMKRGNEGRGKYDICMSQYNVYEEQLMEEEK